MNKRELQRTMYELSGPSKVQGLVLVAILGLWVVLGWWLLVGGGTEVARRLFGPLGEPGDLLRRVCLATAFSIYYFRILFTEFVFLKRGVAWNEVFTIALWLLFIFLLLTVAGGTNPESLGAGGFLGIAMFFFGSWMNTYSEYERHTWKQRSENHGKLYTEGLFRYSRHPNYLGDLFLFSGMCMIAGRWLTIVIPVLMLCVFVFVNIPVLDAHLHDHYGSDFDSYASRTSKLIPFLY